MSCVNFSFLMLVSIVGLNGCGYFTSLPYSSSGIHWAKKGVDYDDMLNFYLKCYKGRMEVSDSRDVNLIFNLEIEGQNCMLEHGFSFEDASWPDKKMCSMYYARAMGINNYMIFPVCQAKYGKYRK